MTVNKLERFAENATLSNVLEHTDYQDKCKEKPKNNWHHIFDNTNPLNLELGCGTGKYTIELARHNPCNNYIGIDIKGARIWKGAKQAAAEELANVRFLRIFIEDLSEYFAVHSIREIWITFADPYPRAKNREKRLTSAAFLDAYATILQPDGSIHFKTDAADFFNFTCREIEKFGGTIIQKIPDLYGENPPDSYLNIQTSYEKRHLEQGKKISYCSFTLSG